MFSDADINKYAEMLNNKKEYTDSVKKYLLDTYELDLTEKFIIAISRLSSQMYGPLLEKILIKYLNLTPVSSRLNIGDAKNDSGDHFEIKCGMVNNGSITLFQVRQYQKLKAYISFHYWPERRKVLIHYIPKEEMTKLCSAINCSSHGAGTHGNEEKQVKINVYSQDHVKYRALIEEVEEFVR